MSYSLVELKRIVVGMLNGIAHDGYDVLVFQAIKNVFGFAASIHQASIVELFQTHPKTLLNKC